MIKEAIIKLSDKIDLTSPEAEACINEIMEGNTSQVQTAAFLMGLAVKGETNDEIAACAKAMRAHATHLEHDREVLEIVGTGGDRSGSFNISSTSALVIAAAGVTVAKHGNRAASSKCGAADLYEALGVNIMLDANKMAKVLKDTNIAFMYAQVYHTSMKYVGPVRKELGCHTVFNLLGPLTNPAFNTRQILGVYREDLVEPMADILTKLGINKGMVVYSRDGMDEITSSNETVVCEFNGTERKNYLITPEQFGLTCCKKADLIGGTPEENVQITKDILNGKKGPQRDTVLMNVGAALYIADKVPTLAEGISLAAETIDSGKAKAKAEEFVRATNA